MATINSVRLININYNNNSMKINDETMHFNGESTLVSLKNGGGKSVLIQMLMSPFVHKKYRDAKDRPFESYFTSAKPSFILLEWNLDGGAGKLLTGLMVRRNQAGIDENGEPLEITSIISFYRDTCICDINHLPVVEKSKKEMVLRNYGACRQLFDSYKKDSTLTFFCYDMNMQAQSKQYFNKLKEYKIDYKEWEKIIKKVNLKESGLSDLFADCKDEKGLVEKWFLETVEEKLSSENNRMNEFQNIIDKHVRQYSENESKIKRRDIIKLFKEYVCLDTESKSVLTLANEFVAKENEESGQENKIANYIKILKTLYDDTSNEIEEKETFIKEIASEISHLTYEKYSCEINDLLSEKKQHERIYSQAVLEKNDIEAKITDIDNKLHALECAKVNETKQYERTEYERLNEKKKALDKKEEDKEPRRNELGTVLYLHYDELCEECSERLDEKEENIRELHQNISQIKSDIKEFEAENVRLAGELAAIKEKINGYGSRESEFNKRYGEQLSRNILGKYEEGFFEIFREESEGNLKKREDALKSDNKILEERKKDDKRIARDLEDTKVSKGNRQNECDNFKRELEQLEDELSKRKDILTYLELEEQYIYDRERIALTAERKINEKDEMIKRLSKQESDLEKEYRALTKGEILELPSEFTKELDNLEINIIFGMEWLKKNGRSDKENIELVRKSPFLPYALIMSENDIRKLENKDTDIYTSFPIPIVAREDIESGEMKADSRVYSFDGIKFYVYFNENFLDEEKLRILVAQKEEELTHIAEKIKQRKSERDSYSEKKNLVLNQRVSKELYDGVTVRIEEAENELQRIGDLITKLSAEKEKNSEDIRTLEAKIKEDEKLIDKWKDKLSDIKRLDEEYRRYLENIDRKAECETNIYNVEYKKELAAKQADSMYDRQRTLENERNDIRRELERNTESLSRYKTYAELAESLQSDKADAGYKVNETDKTDTEYKVNETDKTDTEYKVNETDKSNELNQDITKLEAEYEAITSKISSEKKELEDSIRIQAGRLKKAEKELDKLIKKYGIRQEQFEAIVYNEEEVDHKQEMRAQYEYQNQLKEKECNKENTEIEVLNARVEQSVLLMKRETGNEEPIAENKLVRKNFDAEINQLKFRDIEVKKQKALSEARRHSYGENIAGLAEFDELPITGEVDFNRDFSSMPGGELTNFKKILVRDYNTMKDEKLKCKEALERRLNYIVQMEQFGDEYFKKPLEAMIRLVDTPNEVIRQIDMTIRSYDELMKKIEVDISVIEREREEIVAQLMEYVKEVHDNLGKIDSNSTIKMRENSDNERSVKMLKIELPQWQENAGMYENRVKDFVDDITAKGVELYHNNENTFNYFGTKINTKNLYDVVVGISNVQIKLFKIEQYKEYPITWAEVAKNSGGEGFLSSFVILSSLLYYMRRDDSDIFADNNESKVLLMDNPFAATYSEHLLKPLMKVAKKNHTQLICLTGLGGDSIYGRFDNIYVLNLVSAGLKRGVQYLRTDHVRGSEPEVMVMSHVEVGEPEQLTLF